MWKTLEVQRDEEDGMIVNNPVLELKSLVPGLAGQSRPSTGAGGMGNEGGGGGDEEQQTKPSVVLPAPSSSPTAVKPPAPGMSSQNYEEDESEISRLYELDQHDHGVSDPEMDRAIRRRTLKRAFIRWMINLLMALVIELIYLFISFCSATLIKDKAKHFHHQKEAAPKYFINLGYSFLYASAAFFMVFLVPSSAGSGIPETKAFLNGVRIPNMQSLRTLGGKVFGTIFAVAAGLPVGKYGPMIHIGSIVAAFMSRGARGIKQVDHLFESFRLFSTHAEKRDLVVSGTAAGVTAAFGAPIGGLMLAWEEGSSYWSLKVSWRVFFCAMTTLLFTHLIAATKIVKDYKFVNQSYVESYAGSFSTGIRTANRDLPIFVCMGVVGGLMGAAFNMCHRKMSALRAKYVNTWGKKFLEVLFVTWLVNTVGFIAATNSEPWACRPRPPADPRLYDDGDYVVQYFPGLYRLTCPEGYYNEVASLFLNDGVTAMRLIFHVPRINPATNDLMFSQKALSMFVCPYLFLLILTFGIAIPSGFFVPQLLVGASLGRIVGESLIGAVGIRTYFGQGRIFAIMGSAAFVGGISRMVLSMTVIMLEATGDLFLLVPFAIVLMVSHWVGDFFTPSIFDMIIEMKKFPFLKPDPPKWTIGVLRGGDLMTPKVVTLRPIETVGRIKEILVNTQHNLFPLVYPEGHERQGAMFGTLMRQTLVVLIQSNRFSSTNTVNTDPDSPDLASPIMDMPTILKKSAMLKTRELAYPVMHISAEEEKLWVDLRPYSNPSIYYVTDDSSAPKVYRLFRGLGLRHLLVLNPSRDIAGIITRYDLMPVNMKKRYEEIKAGKRASKLHYELPEKERVKLLARTWKTRQLTSPVNSP